LPTAQALDNVPRGTRLIRQFLFRAWICRWQLACNNSRLSNVSRPPKQRHLRWWMCHGCSSTRSACWHTTHLPPCPFQRYSIRPRPASVWPSFQTLRSSRYTSHDGSYGLAPLRSFSQRNTRTLAAFISRIGQVLPLLSRITPLNTQASSSVRWKYFFLSHFQLLLR